MINPSMIKQFSFVKPAYAACDGSQKGFNIFDCLELKSGTPLKDTYATPADLVNIIIPNLFIFGGIILFGLIVYAGFQFVSKGSKGVEEAKNIITTALTGFLLMFAAYWIIQIIAKLTGANINF